MKFSLLSTSLILSTFAVLSATAKCTSPPGNNGYACPLAPSLSPCNDCPTPACPRTSGGIDYNDRCNPCAGCKCPTGYTCKLNQIQCFAPPCYPLAACRPIYTPK